nr:hypothetical protein [Tanacetum cinerariifolium]
MRMQESKIDMGKAVNDDLVVTKSSGTESKVQDDNSRSGNDTDADDADIRPIYDEEPMAKEVNSHAKIQSHKIKDRNKPVAQKSHTQKPGRQIFTGHKFSPNKTFAVYEKISPRSNLRWKPTGRIFKSVGLRSLPTGKLFDSFTSKVKSGPTHGSNIDISKIHKCIQTLDLSVGTSINVPKEQNLDASVDQNSSDLAPECQKMALNHDSLSPAIQRQEKVVSKSFAVSAADAPNQGQQLTTPLNNHTTPAPTCQILTLAPTVISSENI